MNKRETEKSRDRGIQGCGENCTITRVYISVLAFSYYVTLNEMITCSRTQFFHLQSKGLDIIFKVFQERRLKNCTGMYFIFESSLSFIRRLKTLFSTFFKNPCHFLIKMKIS